MRVKLKQIACHTRAHCRTCRTDAGWRERVTGAVEFDCPHGVTADNLPAAPNPPAAGPGSRFHELIASKYGLKPCQKCLEVIEEMNGLGIDGCKQAKTRIIDGIWQRRDQLKGWKAIAAKLPGSEVVAKHELGRLFDEAVKTQAVGLQ